jgi:hypothetical protein
MPYQIVIQVQAEDEAKELVRRALLDNAIYTTYGETPGDFKEYKVDVIWVARRPAKYCDPSDGHRGKAGWTRGRGYGWWVCAVCHLPTKDWANNMERMRYSLGVNLLPPPIGWNHSNDVSSNKIWKAEEILPQRTSTLG